MELEAPVVTLGGRDLLQLRFDVLADEAEPLRYSISHCDRHWQRDDLEPYEFMQGFESGSIEEVEFSFATRRHYVHYRLTLPANGAEFTASGNYVVAVTSEETGDTLLTRRFWVTEEMVKVRGEVTKPYDGGAIMQRQELDVRVEGGSRTTGPFVMRLDPRPEYTSVLAQQNGRLDNQRWLEFSGYDGQMLAYQFRPQNSFV